MIWKRARKSHKGKQDPVIREQKQADLDMLELASASGEIDLKYLDESGFCAQGDTWLHILPKRRAKARLFKQSKEFSSWCRQRDPGGMGWRYENRDQLYHPVK